MALKHDWRGPDGMGEFFCEYCGVRQGHNEGEPCERRQAIRKEILAHAKTIDWAPPPTLEEQNATLRADNARLTAELAASEARCEALMAAGWALCGMYVQGQQVQRELDKQGARDVFYRKPGALERWMEAHK